MPEAEDRIRGGGATLAFDTNAIISVSRADRRLSFSSFWGLCDAVNRLRDEAPEPLDVSIVVPALAHLEALHDLRTSLGPGHFDRSQVDRQLSNKQVTIAPFHVDAAVSASGILHRWFPSDEAWQAAKRARMLEMLALQDAPGQSGLASIDWVIAAQAEAEGWILVTDDTRAEFSRVSHKIRKSDLRALIDDLLAQRGL